MPKISAGILMYRFQQNQLQVLLVHPGGPFFKNKDDGAWSIPKGEAAEGEELLATAQREFAEELGAKPAGPFRPLTSIQQKGGKIVHAWACEGNFDTTKIECNTFPLEWPPRSGKFIDCPEIDRAEFFDVETAKRKINAAQAALVDELAQLVSASRS